MDPKLKETIEAQVKSKPVFIYMKGTPQFPQCGFSARAIQALKNAGVQDSDLGHFDVFEDDSIREGVKQFSNWPTLPQIYVKGEFIGGSDIVMEMLQTGELQKMLKA